MPLSVAVMRGKYEATNRGFSSICETIVVSNVEGPVTRRPSSIVAKLVPGNLPGTAKLVTNGYKKGDMCMFGGNFAYSSDSRWCRAVEDICGSRQSGAVPIHDRYE